jgi:hypothetical protein
MSTTFTVSLTGTRIYARSGKSRCLYFGDVKNAEMGNLHVLGCITGKNMSILMAAPATMNIMTMVQPDPRKMQYIQGKRCLELIRGALAIYGREHDAEVGLYKAVVDVVRAAREVITERSREKGNAIKLAREAKALKTV